MMLRRWMFGLALVMASTTAASAVESTIAGKVGRSRKEACAIYTIHTVIHVSPVGEGPNLCKMSGRRVEVTGEIVSSRRGTIRIQAASFEVTDKEPPPQP